MTTKAKRDLVADLAICEASTPGPLYAKNEEWPGNANLRYWVDNQDDGIGCFVRYEDAKFAAEAREGWPYAIRRAIAAETDLLEWKTRAQEAEDLAEYLRERAAIASGWSIARKAQVDRLVGVLAELLSAIDRGDIEPSVVDIAKEALEDAAQTSE